MAGNIQTLDIRISFLCRKYKLGLNTDQEETRTVTHCPSNDLLCLGICIRQNDLSAEKGYVIVSLQAGGVI